MATEMKPALRLQVVTSGILTVDIVGEWDAIDGLSGALARAKAAAGRPMGGSMTALASLPRLWDVPVGSPVYLNLGPDGLPR